jgi:trans-aconitate methyltransferase
MESMTWDADRYARDAAFVPTYGIPVLELLDPQPGERILDLGCGDGTLTAQIAERGASVVAVDASPDMVRAARERGLAAEVVDAAALPYVGEFDAVFSNAVLHWIPDLEPVLAGVHRALRPGGRFVGECGGPGNVAAVGLAVTAARLGRGQAAPANPWHGRSTDEFAAQLAAAGLDADALTVFPRPTPLPEGLVGWLAVFGQPLLGDLPAATREDVIADAAALADRWLADHAGRIAADYVRLRFRALRPAES